LATPSRRLLPQRPLSFSTFPGQAVYCRRIATRSPYDLLVTKM